MIPRCRNAIPGEDGQRYVIDLHGNDRCVPSQRGLLLLFLQPQNDTVPLSSALNSTGENPLPLCEPSQNGWLPLLPQAHHQYDLPASTSIRYGLFCAITGCVPDISNSPFSWF